MPAVALNRARVAASSGPDQEPATLRDDEGQFVDQDTPILRRAQAELLVGQPPFFHADLDGGIPCQLRLVDRFNEGAQARDHGGKAGD